MKSIFPKQTLRRKKIKWEEHLGVLTPFENHEGVWFKRDDYFAPLGYHGPNGSKMRQLIWLVNERRFNTTHAVTGASIQSPQLSMSAIVCAHYGLRARIFVYSKPHTILTHDNPRIAAGFNAHFEYVKGPYNPIIQKAVHDAGREDSFEIPYGISIPTKHGSKEKLLEFHDLGANQVSNLPGEVETLIVPAGSCNSLCSVLLGLSRDSKNLRKLKMIGIGPEKMPWVEARMEKMGVNVREDFDFEFDYVNIQTNGYSTYSQKFKGESWDGIDFHPTYEGKMWRWLREEGGVPQDDRTAFWIVGAEGKPEVIEPHYLIDPREAGGVEA